VKATEVKQLKGIHMRLDLLCGLIAAAAAMPAHAGFIDERKPAATEAAGPAAQPSSPVGLTGDFSHVGWDAPARVGEGATPLSMAIIRLLPDGHPAVTIDAPDNLLDAPVTWPNDVSRRAALSHIATQQGVRFSLDGRVMKVRSAAANTAAAGTPAKPEPPKWTVDVQDITLAKTIDRWAARAGWRVRWDAERHVLISAPAVYGGSFEDAVAAVLATPGIRNSQYPIEACVYQNTPPLLRITRMGDQVNECPAQ
jgi:hypothetical protein